MMGLVFLVLTLYLIGKNRNLFGATYVLKARFENVQGLKPGNNVRYAGIDVGTVKKIDILNDTLLEVSIILEDRMLQVIRKNALASIGTDGFVGNKLVNILPSHYPAELAQEGDVLGVKKSLDTDELIRSFSKTGTDISGLTASIRKTFDNLNSSQELWSLLNDPQLSNSIRRSALNIEKASASTDSIMNGLHLLVQNLNEGKGTVGQLLRDTAASHELKEAIVKMEGAGFQAQQLLLQLQDLTELVKNDLNAGSGPLGALIKDTAMTSNLRKSIQGINKGAGSFNQVMEAIKHSFLFRPYFRKRGSGLQ
jgi:phospholipid/cholesterol/gamma-HCH transport system substrate-binding protein